MNKSKAWINMRDSFWFMPAVYSVLALILVILTSLVDVWLASGLPDDLLKQMATEKDTATKLYATLVTAILTMTTLSFSVIMVVLTTYASEFSPRILQNFMKSKFTQHVLGLYSLGFIFALVFLLLVDYGEPIIGPLLMVIIAIINLGAFVYFIHHSARFLQVNNLIDMLKNAGTKIIEQQFEKEKSYKSYHTWKDKRLAQLTEKKKTVLTANDSGYVQNIQWDGLMNWATKNNSVIELHVQPGSFIPKELPTMTVWTDEELTDDIHPFLIIGNERSDLQDFEFVIQKLGEIALRSISPAPKDPHTAINCMNRIGILLADLGQSYEETPYLADQEDHLRMIHHPKSYEYYLYKSFYQLRYFGQKDISILYGILDVLAKAAAVSRPNIKQKIWEFQYYILSEVEWSALPTLDQGHLQEVYDRLKANCEVNQDEGF